MQLFLQFGSAKERTRRERILGVALHQRLVGPDRSLQVALFFRGLPNMKQLFRFSAHLFIARRHVLDFFTWLKNHRGHAEPGKSEAGRDQERKDSNSEIHWSLAG